MARVWAGAVGAVFLMAVAGCSSSKADHEGADQVDPQVFQDVVEYIMPLGDSAGQARGRRIQNFAAGLAMMHCGGRSIPLDYVSDTAGDIELIRERGFPPDYDPVVYYGLDYDPYDQPKDPAVCPPKSRKELIAERERGEEWRSPLAEAAEAVNRLGRPWQELQVAVNVDPAVVDQARALVDCFEAFSGVRVGVENVVDNFGGLVLNQSENLDKLAGWTDDYADCMEPYVKAVAERLRPEREEWIEKYREVLEAFAVKLVDLGYTP